VNKFFQSNIGRYGRIARGVNGTICLIAGIVMADYVLWLCLLLVAVGLFVIIEALSGWSLALACDRRRKH
jgi:hypothetical protein